MRKIFVWALVFAALGSTTYSVLQPHNEAQAALAYAAENDKKVVVLPETSVNKADKQEEKGLQKVAKRLSKKNTICTVDNEQAAFLSSQYNTDTDTINSDGEDVDVFKIEKAKPSQIQDILSYLRSTGEEPRCVVVPTRNWYYAIFAGTVS